MLWVNKIIWFFLAPVWIVILGFYAWKALWNEID